MLLQRRRKIQITVINKVQVLDALHYTYIIGHYNHLVKFIVLVSHTTYIVCIKFYIWMERPTV